MARLIETVEEAVSLLRSGALVGLPTETVYGLAASAGDAAAVVRVFRVKGRPAFDPLIVHVAGTAQARAAVAHGAWGEVSDALARAFWPGALTLVLPRAGWVGDVVTAGLGTVGVRVPDHPLTLEVIRGVGDGGLAMPSANRFGMTSPTTAAHVLAAFAGDDVAVIDGGDCTRGIESTVARVDESGRTVTVLRPGLITRNDIQTALVSSAVFAEVAVAAKGERGASPGSTDRHYAPGVPVALVEGADDAGEQAVIEAGLAALRLDSGANASALELGGDAYAAARVLYASLRDRAAIADALVVVRRSDQSGGAWDAVWDRVERAADSVTRAGQS